MKCTIGNEAERKSLTGLGPGRRILGRCLRCLEHHLKIIASTIKECSNLLKNGGLFAFSVVSTETEIPFRYKPPEHLTYWTKESIRLLLKALHFELLFLEQDTMWQRSNVYIDLICSRIPDPYHKAFKHAKLELPEYVQIPTNELFCVSRKL